MKSKGSRTRGRDFNREPGRERVEAAEREMDVGGKGHQKCCLGSVLFMGFVEINKNLNYVEIAFLLPKSLCVCVCGGRMFPLLGLSPETEQQSCPSSEIKSNQ